MLYEKTKIHIDPMVVDKNALETWKTIKTAEGNRKIGITMADKALCNYSSIEQAQKELQKRFVGYPNIMKKFEKDISKKAIAISVAMDGFELGDQMQEFWPIEDRETVEGDCFIFQKLSENVQVTYYVENGHEYLAGVCYYPLVESEWHNRDKEPQMKEDMNAIEKAYKLAKIMNAPLFSEGTKNPATTTPSTSSSIQVDLHIIQRILESGIGHPECLKMNSMAEDTKIPLIHKDTKEALPEEKRPQIKDLVRFLVENPELSLDVSLFNEISIEPETLSPVFSNTHLLKDANDVETSTEHDCGSIKITPSGNLSSENLVPLLGKSSTSEAPLSLSPPSSKDANIVKMNTTEKPVTKHPFKPEIIKNTVGWKTWVSKGGRPMIGFTLAVEDSELPTTECREACRGKLGEWLIDYPEFLPIRSLPKSTIAVSFAHRNFKVGKTCQEFLPLDKFKVPDDAFYTYQMISKNVQVTYYNEKGVEYLAGICWYLPSDGMPQSWSLDLKLINVTQFSAEVYPQQDRNKSINMIKNNKYGRYCKTAGRRVVVDCNTSYGLILHFGVNVYTNSWEYTPCKECEDDYYNYKWVEPKTENPTPIDSPKPSEATDGCSSSSDTTLQSEELSSASEALTTKIEEGSAGSRSAGSPAIEKPVSKVTEQPEVTSSIKEDMEIALVQSVGSNDNKQPTSSNMKEAESSSAEEVPSQVARHPFVPETLKHAVDWKTFATSIYTNPKVGYTVDCELVPGHPIIGLTLAEEGSEFSTPECLEACGDKLQLWLRQYPECPPIPSLPKNTIAVSFAHHNFKVGKTCQEFLPLDNFEVPDDAFYTYKMISENLQITYYNEEGAEFIAGICWYLASDGMTQSWSLDIKRIYVAEFFSARMYPLLNKYNLLLIVKKLYKDIRKMNKVFGKYCKKAGRQVAIYDNMKDGLIRHIDVNSNMDSWVYTSCKECNKEYSKSLKPKKEAPTPVEKELVLVVRTPLTKQPFEPEILKLTVHWKTWLTKAGIPKFGFTQAAEDSELAPPECLEAFRQKLARRSKDFDPISSIPKNTIAISIAQCNFKVGKSCQEFLPLNKFRAPDDASYTYHMIAENVQATYYNENGAEFLAGVCWYFASDGKTVQLDRDFELRDSSQHAGEPCSLQDRNKMCRYLASDGKTQNWKLDLKLLNLSQLSAEPFPLQDRNKSFNMINNNTYGRYCKTTGRRVAVHCNRKLGTICHVNVLLNRDSYKYTRCEECSDDHYTYNWVKPKRDLPELVANEPLPEVPAPVTRQPLEPEILNITVHWKTWLTKAGNPKVAFTQTAEDSELATWKCLEAFREKLGRWLGRYEEFKPIPSLPRNTIAISFAQHNFKVGKSCQEFLPLDKFKVPDDAFYTYQMISKNVQVTYYNEKGVEYLAGICWYLASDGETQNWSLDLKLIDVTQLSAELFPLQDRNKSVNMIKNNIYGRYCETAGRRVAVDCRGKLINAIRHVGVNLNTNSWVYSPCEECHNDYFKYKWMEPKKQTPTSTVSPKPSEATDSCLSSLETTVQSEDFSTTTEVLTTKPGEGSDGSGCTGSPAKASATLATPAEQPNVYGKVLSKAELLEKLVGPVTHYNPWHVMHERRMFFERLIDFCERNGEPINMVPQVSKQSIDLHRLYIAVRAKGGFLQVTMDKYWKNLCTEANPDLVESSAAGYQLRKHYQKHLLMLECRETGRNPEDDPAFADKMKRQSKREPAGEAVAATAAAASQQGTPGSCGAPPSVPPGAYPENPTTIDSPKPSETAENSSNSSEMSAQSEDLSTTTEIVKTEEKTEKVEDDSSEEKAKTRKGEDGSKSTESETKETPEANITEQSEATSPTKEVVEIASDKPTESDDDNNSTSNSMNDAESSTTEEPEFLDTSSTASSDSFLEDYDQIENTENFTESDKEFDADVIY